MFQQTMTLGSKLASGFGLTILGMGVVFAILLGISFALDALRFFLAEAPPPRAPFSLPRTKSPEAVEDERELVAVITAAVAEYTGARSEQIRVKSIRSLPHSDRLWGAMGRHRQMSDRL